ncbi:MAG: hypothetical protein WBA51_00120 [Erythrobacter sp.]
MDSWVEAGTWSLLTAALCTGSWLVGEVVGAARSRRIFAASQPGLAEDMPVGALVVEEWRLAGAPSRAAQARGGPSVTPVSTRSAACAPQDRAEALSLEPEDQVIESEHKRRRREMFAQMPPLAELRANADAMRRTQSLLGVASQSVWDDPSLREGRVNADPIAERVLGHYRQSICELRSVNGEDDGLPDGLVYADTAMKQPQPVAAKEPDGLLTLPPAGKEEFLRFAIAAPVPLDGFTEALVSRAREGETA